MHEDFYTKFSHTFSAATFEVTCRVSPYMHDIKMQSNEGVFLLRTVRAQEPTNGGFRLPPVLVPLLKSGTALYYYLHETRHYQNSHYLKIVNESAFVTRQLPTRKTPPTQPPTHPPTGRHQPGQTECDATRPFYHNIQVHQHVSQL